MYGLNKLAHQHNSLNLVSPLDYYLLLVHFSIGHYCLYQFEHSYTDILYIVMLRIQLNTIWYI